MNNTKKENQHFIPKFYLRYFSYQGNGREIGVYNQKNKLFIPRAKLKTQASKKYFYGKDGKIEDSLASIEDSVAPIMKEIIVNQKLPKYESSNQEKLLYFLILLNLRNPNRIHEMIKGKDLVIKRLINTHPLDLSLVSALKDVNTHEENIKGILYRAKEMTSYCMDLNYKILENTTDIPFIISDYPLIIYNQFLEKRKWIIGGHSGFGTIGTQMFLPLNYKYLIMFYDAMVYKVGNKKETMVNLNDTQSINQLNLLQYLNSSESLFFNHQISKHYVETLIDKGKSYKKANDPFIKVYHIDDGKGGVKDNEEVISIGSTDLKINLSLQKVKYNSRAMGIKLDNRAAQLRPNVEKLFWYNKNMK